MKNNFSVHHKTGWTSHLRSKNTYITLIVVMVIAALLIIWFPYRSSSTDEVVRTIYPPCIDSDKSNDPLVKGVVNYSYGKVDGPILPSQFDSCEGSSLKQVDCSPDGVLVNTIYSCSKGNTCQEGICVPLKCWSEGKGATLYLYKNINPCSDRLAQFSNFSYLFPSSANYKCLGVETGVSLVQYSGYGNFPISYVGKIKAYLGVISLAGKCPVEQKDARYWIEGQTTNLDAAKRCVDEGKDNFEFYEPSTC